MPSTGFCTPTPGEALSLDNRARRDAEDDFADELTGD
jgi:hypothetical protein